MLCIQYEYIDTIKLLIDIYDVDIAVCDSAGYNALHYAAQSGNLDIIIHLCNSWQCVTGGVCTATEQYNILHICSMNGYIDCIKYIGQNNLCDINAVDCNGWSSMHHAIYNNHINCVQYYIQSMQLCNIYQLTNDNWTLLHVACYSPYTTPDTLSLLAQYNIDVYSCDVVASTCLTLACIKYRFELVEWLLDTYIWPYQQLLYCVICVMQKFNNDIRLIQQHQLASHILYELKLSLNELQSSDSNNNPPLLIDTEQDDIVHLHSIANGAGTGTTTPRIRKSISTPTR